MKKRLEPFAIVAWRTAPAALRLASLRVGGNIAGTLYTRGSQAEAAEHAFKLATLLRIGVFRLPPHRLPAIEKRAGLVTGPAKFIENIGSPRLHRCAEVLDGEIGRVASVFQILLAPFRFPGRGRPLGSLATRLRSRRTLRPATATYGTRLARSFRRRTSRLPATRLAAGLALLLGFALRLCSPLACRASGWLATFLWTVVF